MQYVNIRTWQAVGLILVVLSTACWGDSKFNKLIRKKKYTEAITYADANLPPASRDVEAWVSIGNAHQHMGRAEKALVCYEFGRRLDRGNYDALLGCASVYNQLNRPKQAFSLAKQALRREFTPKAGWEYARACAGLHRIKEAKSVLEKVVTADPSNFEAVRELGILYFEENNYEIALPLLQETIKRRFDGDVALRIGKIYASLGDSESAIACLAKVVKQDPSRHNARLALARALCQAGQYRSAIREFELAFPHVDAKAGDYYRVASAKMGMGDTATAVRLYQSCLAKFGKFTSKEALLTHRELGCHELRSNHAKKAMRHFQFILRADPGARTVRDVHFCVSDAWQALSKPDKAMAVLKKAIQLNPRNVEAHARLAAVYEKKNMRADARKIYETMLRLGSNDPHVYLILGQYQMKMKGFQKALEFFLRSNEIKPSAQASEGMALCAMELGELDIAKQAARSALRMNPGQEEFKLILVQIHLKEANHKEATRLIQQLIKQNPKDVGLWKNLATCYLQASDFAGVAKIDRKIIELDSRNLESRMRLANYSLSENDLHTALAMYKEIAALTPKRKRVYLKLVEILTKLSREREAIDYLKKYLETADKDAGAYCRLGGLFCKTKDYENAIKAYRIALGIDPKTKGFYKQYARAVMAKGSPKEQVRVLAAAVQKGEADSAIVAWLASAYAKAGKMSKAIEAYDRLVVMNPENTEALSQLGWCHVKRKNVAKAILCYEQAVMIKPSLADEYKVLGNLYTLQKQDQKAMKSFTTYLEKKPNDSNIARTVGMWALHRKEYVLAVKYLGMVNGKLSTEFPHRVALAKACYYAGNFDKVVPILESLVPLASNDETAKTLTHMLADAYEKTGQNQKAAETHLAYARLSGENNSEVAFKAAFLLEKSDPERAKSLYENNIQEYPEDYRNYYRLGRLKAKQRTQIPVAIALLERSTDFVDTLADVWIELARLYGEVGDQKAQLSTYQKLLRLDPQNQKGNSMMGAVYYRNGEINKSIGYLERALITAPTDFESTYLLAQAYTKLKVNEYAMNLLEKANQLKPGEPKVVVALAKLRWKTGQRKRGMEEMERLVQGNSNPDHLFLYAEMLMGSRKYKQAEEIIARVQNTIKDNRQLDVLMMSGLCLKEQGKLKRALSAYQRAAEINPQHAPAYCGRAEVYLESGELMWAEMFYRRALEKDPDYALAEYGLAKVAKEKGRNADYVQHLKKAKTLDPENETIVAELIKAEK